MHAYKVDFFLCWKCLFFPMFPREDSAEVAPCFSCGGRGHGAVLRCTYTEKMTSLTRPLLFLSFERPESVRRSSG